MAHNAPSIEQINSWLEELPYTNVGKTAELVHDYLKHLPHSNLSPTHHLAILETLKKTIDYLWNTLRKHFIGQTTLSYEQRPKIVALAQAIEDRCATTYALLIKDIVLHHPKGFKDIHLTALYRSLFHLRRVLLASYLMHAKAPKNLWLKLHKLYIHGKKHNLLHIPIELEKHNVTVEGAYKHCLLISTANPFHLDEVDLDKVDQALLLWANYAEIMPIADTRTIFTVHTHLDLRPQYRKFDTHPLNDEENSFGLNTEKLIEHVEKCIKQRSENEISKTIMTPMPKSLMLDLIDVWGHLHQRQHDRVKAENHIICYLGLNDIHFVLHCDAKMKLDKTLEKTSPLNIRSNLKLIDDADKNQKEPDIESKTESSSHYYDPWDLLTKEDEKKSSLPSEEDSEEQHKKYEWRITNKSQHGFCLISPENYLPTAQPGELIILREKADQTDWNLGIICWIRSTQEEGTHLGIETLAKNPTAAALELQQENFAAPIKAILLKGTYANQLIIPCIDICEQQQALLQYHDFKTPVTLGTVEFSNKYFFRIPYDTGNTEKESIDFREEKLKNDPLDKVWDDF